MDTHKLFFPFQERRLTTPVLWRSCVGPHSYCEFKQNSHVMPRDKCLTLLTPPSGSQFLSDVPFMTGHSGDAYSQFFDSVLASGIHYWWPLQKESLTIADYFKGNWIVTSCPISKTITFASPLGPMTIRTMIFWLADSTRSKFSFVEWASNRIREQWVTSITDLPLLHPSSLAGQ